jgi:hypothetical protein
LRQPPRTRPPLEGPAVAHAPSAARACRPLVPVDRSCLSAAGAGRRRGGSGAGAGRPRGWSAARACRPRGGSGAGVPVALWVGRSFMCRLVARGRVGRWCAVEQRRPPGQRRRQPAGVGSRGGLHPYPEAGAWSGGRVGRWCAVGRAWAGQPLVCCRSRARVGRSCAVRGRSHAVGLLRTSVAHAPSASHERASLTQPDEGASGSRRYPSAALIMRGTPTRGPHAGRARLTYQRSTRGRSPAPAWPTRAGRGSRARPAVSRGPV